VRGDHVVDQAVLVGETCRIEIGLELGFEDLLEDVLNMPSYALRMVFLVDR